MYTEGFINLHRKILEWEWYDDINVKIVFIHLLLTANWTKAKWHGIEVLPGQRITSREILANETGLSEQNIRTALKKLKNTGEITIKSTNKYTLVTIVNYGLYQSKKEKITGKLTNNQPTDNQQLTNNQPQYNKDNKYNNKNNKLNKIKLNSLYLYITEKEKSYEGLSDMDKISIQSTLKKLELYIEDDKYIPEERIFDLQLKYYAITQIYLSPYKVYLMDLKEKDFTKIFLSAKQYIPINEKTEKNITEFMNYFIVCLRKEFEK